MPLVVLGMTGLAPSASGAAASLSITPLEWNIIGLDSNNPSAGPNSFHVGARVCNTGDAPASDITVTWVWDSTSTAITLEGPATRTVASLAAGECSSEWFGVSVTRARTSYDKTRRFHITASATGIASVSTPVPRELYVEKLVSQNRNSITGSFGDKTVYVGRTYTYTFTGKTATPYEQLSAMPFFDPSIFRVESVTKTVETGGTTNQFYSDACGWINDPTSPNYRSCSGVGKTGGTFEVTAKVTVIGTGTTRLSALVYDFSGSSYHYNDDFSDSIYAIQVVALPAPANAGPVAVDDTASTDEDVAVSIGVLGNDTDTDGDSLTVSGTTNPAHGTVTVNPDGTLGYTPADGFSGTDSFDYTVSDGNGGTDTATVTVTVRPVNDAPQARPDSATVDEDSTVTITVLGNDSDPENDPLTVTGTGDPGHGTTTVNSNGTITYTPTPDYSGPDSFEYTISDGNGGSDTATVSITVRPVNDDPRAGDDTGSTQVGTPTEIAVLSNDTDADGDPLNVTGTSVPAHGTVTVNPDGTITYTPDSGYTGSDSFTYTVSDGNGGTATATVTITVSPMPPANSNPQADNDAQGTDEDTPVVIAVLLNDSDPEGDHLDVAATSDPAHGSVTVNADGTVTYTPDAEYSGPDSFTYTVSDGNGGTDTATVSVTVRPVNDAPTAVDDRASTDEDEAVTVPVLGNDSDPEESPLTVTGTGDAAHGTVRLNPEGTITYTPNAGYSGTDSFEYTISDGDGGSDTGAVTVTVGQVNDAPSAGDDTASTPQGTAVDVAVRGNDTDADGDSLTVTAVAQPANGTVTVNSDGTVTYTPNSGYNGPDSFEYTVSDGNGGTDTATVRVTVTPVAPANTAPRAGDDTASTRQGTPVDVAVLGNDSDADGDSLTVTAVTQPAHGTVTVNSDGTITYTPDAGYTGPDSFEYTVSDGNGGSDTGTVRVTVTPTAPANSDTRAGDDEVGTGAGSPVTIPVLYNDTDPDGDELSVISATQPAHGTVTVNPDGTITYTPQAGYTGPDSFQYTVSDGNGGTDTATVTVTVGPGQNTGPAQQESTPESSPEASPGPVIPTVIEAGVSGESPAEASPRSRRDAGSVAVMSAVAGLAVVAAGACLLLRRRRGYPGRHL